MPYPTGLPKRLSRRHQGLRGRDELLRGDLFETELPGPPGPVPLGGEGGPGAGGRGLRNRLPQPQDYQDGGAPPPLPIIPHMAERRPMQLSEIGNAEIVGSPKPGFRDRLGDALESVGRQRIFDSQSEDFLEALTGSAFESFSGARGMGRERDIYEADLRNAIVGQAAEGEAQARRDALDEEFKRARIEEIYKGIDEPEPAEVDVEGLAAAYEEAGRGDLATFIRSNPEVIGKDADAWLRGLSDLEEEAAKEKDEEPGYIEKGAIRRTEEAEEYAGRAIAGREREEGTLDPEEAQGLSSRLKRMFDPTYEADSTAAARWRPTLPEAEPEEPGTILGMPSGMFTHGPELPGDFRFPGSAFPGSAEEILAGSIPDLAEEAPQRQPAAEVGAGTSADTKPKEGESARAYIARMKEAKMLPAQIVALAREHGFVQ